MSGQNESPFLTLLQKTRFSAFYIVNFVLHILIRVKKGVQKIVAQSGLRHTSTAFWNLLYILKLRGLTCQTFNFN